MIASRKSTVVALTCSLRIDSGMVARQPRLSSRISSLLRWRMCSSIASLYTGIRIIREGLTMVERVVLFYLGTSVFNFIVQRSR